MTVFPTFPFPEQMTILTEAVTGQDDDGNDVRGATSVTTVGAFAPGTSIELVQGEDTVINQPTAYLNPGEPIPQAVDRLVVRGVTYLVDGDPQVYRNPFDGSEPGAVVRLEKVT